VPNLLGKLAKSLPCAVTVSRTPVSTPPRVYVAENASLLGTPVLSPSGTWESPMPLNVSRC
jgi:hypothetical protein